jgi:hypothetical protein
VELPRSGCAATAATTTAATTATAATAATTAAATAGGAAAGTAAHLSRATRGQSLSGACSRAHPRRPLLGWTS